jgi:predicted amino acid dehydrogenase
LLLDASLIQRKCITVEKAIPEDVKWEYSASTRIRVLKLVEKTLDLIFGLPIIGFCASERALEL